MDRTPIGTGRHLAFTATSAVAFLLLFALLRLGLLLYNRELAAATPLGSLAEAFRNGLRFDLRAVVFVCAPLLLSLLSIRAMGARRAQRYWLDACASVAILLGLIELDFYREFHQRLNSLVFQYLKEDPKTVLSMLWNGFPVLRLLLAWLALSVLAHAVFAWLDRLTRPRPALHRSPVPALRWRLPLLLFCLFGATLAARGTLRQGPPLRWGDAFTTESAFANQLCLNGTLSLIDAARSQLSGAERRVRPRMPAGEAETIVRDLLLSDDDHLVDAERVPVRRDYRPPAAATLPVHNVVVILMESFAGRFVGALGNPDGITPHFDRRAEEGLLFTRFFANGTHTHQGMFATMACFPNLPGFEYLMQTPEGTHQFSGLPQLLGARGYDNLYVYNGDFAWDNQAGFFSNQGMTRFIGRNDYLTPVVQDPTWGVSDQDMFDRAAAELRKMSPDKPFYALLQTLSNHTPYALPESLPVERVSGHGSLDEHLTAMRYSDWALGRFFEQARRSPYYKDTLFVVVGDHGFGADQQLTEMDLFRFHVPLLLIAPGITEKFGSRRETVGTQVDIVPTVMGRLGGEVRHQCWGRDLLDLPEADAGFGIIKPSGSDQTVAIIKGERILVQPRGLPHRTYTYRLGRAAQSVRDGPTPGDRTAHQQLEAYLQSASDSLRRDEAGAR